LKSLVDEKDQHICRLQKQLKKVNQNLFNTPRANDVEGYCSTSTVKGVLNSIRTMQTALHS
jgi:hypothetical protein